MFLSPPKKRRPKLNTIICPSQLICVPPRIPKEHLKTNKTYDIAWLSFYLVVSFFLLEGFYEFLLFSSLPNHLFCRNHTHLFSVAQSRSWGKAERPQHAFQTLKHHRRKRLETEFGWMILKRLKAWRVNRAGCDRPVRLWLLQNVTSQKNYSNWCRLSAKDPEENKIFIISLSFCRSNELHIDFQAFRDISQPSCITSLLT